MAKKQSRKSPILGDFTFNKIDPYGGSSATKTEATRLHIESIMPDPEQPRSLLPKDLYVSLFTGQQRPLSVLKEWLTRGEQQAANPALVESIRKVRQLAATIEHRDLINAITVREPTEEDPTLPIGVKYIIVTGERRWWSHVLLTAEDRPIGGDQHPDRIKATIVPRKNIRALQLIENVARDDLSVLEKAQGIVALRDELSAELGKSAPWTQVEDILGISRSYRSRVLKVLKLSPEAQELVSRYNLQEKTIRPITEQLQSDAALQMTALNQIIAWQTAEGEAISNKRVADYVQTLTTPLKTRTRSKPRDDTSWWVAKFQQRVTHALKLLDTLDDTSFAEASNIISTGNEEGRAQLTRLKDRIDALLEQR